MASKQIANLKKQIAQLETALALPETERKLPNGVTAEFDGENLDLYEKLRSKLADRDSAAEAERVRGEAAKELEQLRQQLAMLEAEDRRKADEAEFTQVQQQLSALLDQVEPLADQLQALFDAAIPLDSRAKILHDRMSANSWQKWQSNLLRYKDFLPRLEKTERTIYIVPRSRRATNSQ